MNMNCINVSQKNNLVIIKINSEANFSDIITQIRKKVIQLKKIQDKKQLTEAKRRQKIDKRKFQENKQQEIKEAKKELNEKYAEEMTKLEDSLSELKKKQEDELKNYFIDFEKNYPTDIKPSNELIEKQRQLDYYIKTEE